jgi:hypothetical protein
MGRINAFNVQADLQRGYCQAKSLAQCFRGYPTGTRPVQNHREKLRQCWNQRT